MCIMGKMVPVPTCFHAFTRFVSFKQILLRRQDLTVLLRRLEALRVEQHLDAHLLSCLNGRVQRAAGTHLRPGGGQEGGEAVARGAADDPEHTEGTSHSSFRHLIRPNGAVSLKHATAHADAPNSFVLLTF